VTNDCFVVSVARFRRINNQSATLFCLCASVCRVARPDDVRIRSAFPSRTPVRACPFLVVQFVSRSQHTLELFCFVFKVCNSTRYSFVTLGNVHLQMSLYRTIYLRIYSFCSRVLFMFTTVLCDMMHTCETRDVSAANVFPWDTCNLSRRVEYKYYNIITQTRLITWASGNRGKKMRVKVNT
jgi:hypothetical protein